MEKDRNRLELIHKIIHPLLKWYENNKRKLPWRENVTPYKVWVSEIMLQQTRVEAVKPYFEQFLMEFPDIESLAKAEEKHLLKLWEGLGYYNRVRNMQKAALQVVEEYDGVMPKQYDELLKLKGIGSYTAGAIASIAYGIQVPAVDGNVLRVLSRVTEDDSDIADSKVKKRIEEELRQVMPVEAGDFNQSLMEIGALICLPNGEPKCGICPINHICKAHKEGREEEFPFKSSIKKRTIEQYTVLVIRDHNQVLLHKRASKGLLAGMYEFPMIPKWSKQEEVIAYVRELGFEPVYVEKLPEAKHIFTHKEWHMKGYMVRTEPLEYSSDVSYNRAEYILADPLVIKSDYAVPSAFSAYTPFAEIELKQNYIRKN